MEIAMTSRQRLLAALVLTCAGIAPTAFAQSAANPHAGMAMPMHDASDASSTASANGDATSAFKSADDAMMHGMSSIEYTGDADRDFVAHMIPHHEGAVAMAQVELKYGKDPKLRKLARDIVAAQEKEIRFMKQWLAAHPQTR
jgi:uncharacterized protein (DUF305 family)